MDANKQIPAYCYSLYSLERQIAQCPHSLMKKKKRKQAGKKSEQVKLYCIFLI